MSVIDVFGELLLKAFYILSKDEVTPLHNPGNRLFDLVPDNSELAPRSTKRDFDWTLVLQFFSTPHNIF